ncbi:MAG: hypothetical protein HY904_24460 [Deltaproteobacteria bacterium]|nr:hypothetical protein [Deltaproteobacteria bacterium]
MSISGPAGKPAARAATAAKPAERSAPPPAPAPAALPTAPTAPAPAAPAATATAQSASEAQASRAHDVHAGVLQGRLGPSAPAAAAPAAPAADRVDIRLGNAEAQQAARRKLLASAPQVNPTSIKAGNGRTLCAGAAVAGALILTDKNGSNARALERTLNGNGVEVSAEEKGALAAFKSGKLTPTDVQHLQQLTYRLAAKNEQGEEPGTFITTAGLETAAAERRVALSPAERGAVDAFRRAEQGGPDLSAAQRETVSGLALRVGLISKPGDGATPPPLIKPGSLAAAVAQLKGYGAFAAGEDVTFHQSRLPVPGGTGEFVHWTASVGGKHFNSLPADGRAQIHLGTPPGIAMKPTDANWEGTVKLTESPRPPRLDVELRAPGQPAGTLTRITARPPTDDEADWSMAALRLTEDRADPAYGVSVDRRAAVY